MLFAIKRLYQERCIIDSVYTMKIKKISRCKIELGKKVNSICTEIESGKTQGSVGKILRQARQKHAVRDLNVIARELCITPYLLEALEQDNFSSFPSSCYAIGFIKNYSNYLGLDTKEVIARYEAEYEGSKECVVLDFPEVEKHNKLAIRSMAGIASLCIAIFVGVWSSYNGIDAEEAIEASAPISALAPVSIEPETIEVQEIITTTMNTDDVRLKANQDVWVRLTGSDGRVRMEKILVRGEDLIAPDDQGISLMTNNAAALSVYVDGAAVKVLGDEGEIIENISFEQKKLLELTTLD